MCAECDVLCICETWSTDLWKPHAFDFSWNHYDIFQSVASKTHVMGRAKGGLMILVNNLTINSELIHSTSNFLFVKLTKNTESCVIGLSYFSPLHNDKAVLAEIEYSLDFILSNYSDYLIFLGGDFNARI